MTMGVIEDRTATLNKTGSLVAALTQFMRITTEVAVPHIYILPSDGVFFFKLTCPWGENRPNVACCQCCAGANTNTPVPVASVFITEQLFSKQMWRARSPVTETSRLSESGVSMETNEYKTQAVGTRAHRGSGDSSAGRRQA